MSDAPGDHRAADAQVAAFYDRHPYPPPVVQLDERTARSEALHRRIEHHLLWPTLPVRTDLVVLVAGCGTSQAARFALRHPDAVVVGVDVSAASLAATRLLADRYELTNLTLQEMPLDEVEHLGTEFDLVLCTGVLHHLAEPADGLRALTDVLSPRGALHLMVYATYGRLGIGMLREYCRRLGVSPERAEIDVLVDTLSELSNEHPGAHLLRNAPDFRDDASLADALLNPRERTYTVPEVFELLDAAGLRFERWWRQAPYRASCGSLSETPHRDRLLEMADVDQFAAVELFRGTITRHDLVAHRRDGPERHPPVRWDDDEWRDYVPLRPDTMVVIGDTDRLPPGAAAALVNRAHTDRDLVGFVDAEALAAYESIDGVRTLGEIDGATAARAESWWHHDHIVIDASAAGAP